ncbi:MAG: hypothetical protein KKA07_07635, partial [Bacteroidetes bacterium]|nr:hypothetical protein [Bacteroidota bacterium]
FRFQGYQIFQVKDASVSVADLHNVNLARQVAQCDKKDGVSRLINYYFDENLGANVAIEEVDGEDAGIKHSFKLTEDQFATGDKRLINHKKYYFIAIAYAYNNYKDYIPTDANSLDGQKQRYKAGRKSPAGSIKSVVGIPHIPTSQSGGVVIQAEYGYGPKITRIEGQGNGGLVLDLTPETETEILSKTSSPYMSVNPEYQNLKGPVDVKVVDPLNVPDARFSLKFVPYDTVALADADIAYTYKDINNVDQTIYLKLGWELTNQTTGTVYTSDQTIGIYNEQVIPEIGLSVAICQTHLPGDTINEELFWDPEGNGVIESSIEYADSSKMWLGGISDVDAPSTMNWIRAGSAFQVDDPYNDYYNLWDAGSGKPLQYVDPKESYEKIINGTWTAYRLAFHDDVVTSPAQPIKDGLAYDMYPGVVTLKFHKENNLTNVASIDLVLTPDQSKWTRCPVLEMQYDNALSQDNGEKFLLRKHASVDINGTNESGTGMGWFPGYAINVETGERLNIAFGEDSWLKADNGADMLFNPTERYYDDVGFQTIFGGKHYVYIFGHNGNSPGDVPAYDQGAYIWNELYAASIMPVTTPIQKINKARKISFVYDDVMWCGIPMKQYGFGTGDADWLACDVKIRIRVNRPYMQNYGVHGSTNPQNNNLPMYEFSTSDIATQFGVAEAAQNALELINIVPNPYYAFSSYETNQLDNRVRITNLPEKCQISIFTLSGSLVRKYDVDKSGVITPRRQGDEESKTSIDWDLKNYAGIPIASGIYLIHVKVEGVGERVIKWFGTMRPVDLDSF